MFAEICSKEITPALAGIWAEQLGDIPPRVLNDACDGLAKTWTSGFLPTPGNVRALIESAQASGLEIEAAEQWERSLRVATEFWHPQIGLYRTAPELSPVSWHAIKAAGGLSHLFSCDRDELPWARKRFIADYILVHETGKVEHLLDDGEAKKILRQLHAGSPFPNRKQLRAAQTLAIDALPPSREEVREVLNRAAENRERPRPEPSEEELRRRAEDQKRRLEALGYDVRTPAPTAEELLARQLAKGQPPKTPPFCSPQLADSVTPALDLSEPPQALVSGGQR